MLRTQILGTGFVVGEHLVKNDDLAKLMDTSDAWIRERSGIEQRYYVKDGTSTSDLAAGASLKAIEDAKIDKGEIDYIVFATMTPDHYFPGCGGILQSKLGLGPVQAVDVRQQCTGFIYGLQLADALLRSGHARTVLLVGAEVHTGFMPWTQWDHLFGVPGAPAPTEAEKAWNTKFRDRTVLFGDAAGAFILRAAEGESGLVDFEMHSGGDNFRDLYVPAGGFAKRPYFTDVDFKEGKHIPEMNGRGVFKMAVTKMPEVVRSICKKNHVEVGQIDLLIAHQANLRINELVQKNLGLPDSRVYNNIQRFGNTTAATIPIAFDECKKSGRIQPGQLICFVGLGAGFHWGAALLRS